MTLHALKHCSRLAFGQVGRVHSVFARACNLAMANGELWVLQTRGMVLLSTLMICGTVFAPV